jgi:SWIM zinc finger
MLFPCLFTFTFTFTFTYISSTPFHFYTQSMSAPASTPESFITSLISRISSLAYSSPPPSNHLDSPSSSRHDGISTSFTSPSKPQTFTEILSALPKENQDSIKDLLTTMHFLYPHEFIPALDLLDRHLVTRMIISHSPKTSSNSRAADPDVHIEPLTEPTTLSAHPMEDPVPSTQGDPTSDVCTETNFAIENEVFYIQSASSQNTTNTTRPRHSRRHHSSNNSLTYEVRLSAWNCTCPAFAFSAFSRALDLSPEAAGEDSHEQHIYSAINNADDASLPKPGQYVKWRFGGTLTLTSPEPESSVRPPTPSVPVCKHILAALLGKQIPDLFASGVLLRTVSLEEGAGWAGGWGDGD